MSSTATAPEKALKENKKSYEAFIYPNVNHGFHNDTTPRYDEAAAKLSWQRTLDFFNKYVKYYYYTIVRPI
jgi:carboxymethylenebutenolidase